MSDPSCLPATDVLLEPARLAALRETGLLDAPALPALEGLSALAARLLAAPVALVSLVDADRQFLAASTGLAEPWATARETPLSHSFCQHVVRSGAPLVVEDARAHPLVRDNPAIDALDVTAYAGMPLVGESGEVLGSLCVIDGATRTWSADALAMLGELARAASAELALRQVTRRLELRTRALESRTRDLAGLLDATGELVCATDAEGRITYVNRAWQEALGYTPEEARALRPVDLVAPEHRARYVATARRLAAGERVDDFEAVLLARDGRRVACRGTGVPTMEDGPDGPRCVGTRALYRDVTPAHEEAARQRQLLAMLEVTTDFVGSVGPDGRVAYLNEAGRRMLKLRPGVVLHELEGMQMHPPATQVLLRDVVLPVVMRDGRWQGEGALLAADGEEIPVSMVVVAHPSRLPGQPATFSAVMRDLRDRVRAEAALEREHAFLAQVLDSLSENVSVCGPDGRLLLFNRATCETHGLPADGSLPPEAWSERYRVFGGDGTTPMPVEALPLVRVLATGAPVADVEYVVRVPGREARTLVAHARPMHDAGGTLIGAVCAARDMTAQKAVERALRGSEQRLQAALDGGRVGFVALRPVRDAAGAATDFDVLAVNAHAAALLGTPEEEMVDQRYGELFPVTRVGGHLDRFARVLETGEAADYEVRVSDPRVQARWMRVQAVPLTGTDGHAEAVGLMLRDVSEELEAREELRLLVAVSHALTQAPDVASAAEAALRLMCEAVGFEYGEAWLTAPGGVDGAGVLRHGPVWHAADDLRLAAFARSSDGFTFAPGEGLPGQAWTRRAPYVVPDVREAEVVVPRLVHMRAAGIRAGVTLPVLARGEVVAVLCFHTRRPRTVETSRVELLAAVAAQVGEVVRARFAEEARRESEARLSLIYESTSDLMFLMRVERDAGGAVEAYRCESVNAAYLALTGLAREQLVGRTVEEILPADAARDVHMRYDEAVATGTVLRYEEDVELPLGRLVVETSLTPVLDVGGACTHLLGVSRDVREQRALQERLAALAEHDELTGLLNRRGFRRLAEYAAKTAVRTARRDAVLYVDLDHFKPINDGFGHAEGDRALCAVADVLRRTVRDADFCARLGGDEFAVYAVGLQPGEGELIAARLQANLLAHNVEAAAVGRPYRIACSIGVAETAAGESLDELLARSDAALYAVKQGRR